MTARNYYHDQHEWHERCSASCRAMSESSRTASIKAAWMQMSVSHQCIAECMKLLELEAALINGNREGENEARSVSF